MSRARPANEAKTIPICHCLRPVVEGSAGLKFPNLDLYGIFVRWKKGVIYNALAVCDAAPGDGPGGGKSREMIGFLRPWNRRGDWGRGILLSSSPLTFFDPPILTRTDPPPTATKTAQRSKDPIKYCDTFSFTRVNTFGWVTFDEQKWVNSHERRRPSLIDTLGARFLAFFSAELGDGKKGRMEGIDK